MEPKFYVCKYCGNLITPIQSSGAPVHCCGEPMLALEANSRDAAVEKHVPVITKKGSKIEVNVGEVPHPMSEAHNISWIALAANAEWTIKHLSPEEEPKAEFCLPESSDFTVYAYCNLHGLWKNNF